MSKRDKSIDEVLSRKLCVGCGTCESACPEECISFSLEHDGQYRPQIDPVLCTNCGKCFRVCPSSRISFSSAIAEPLAVFSGHTKDESLRRDAASGGLATQLLINGLEDGRFDAAVIATGATPDSFRTVIATTKDEVIAAKGSKYAQLPTNRILKELTDSPYQKIAYMALPCQIKALNFYLQTDKSLASRIVIKLSLVCGQSLRHTAVQRQLKALNIRPEELSVYTFRGDGWPGCQRIVDSRGEKNIAYTSKVAMGGLFAAPLSGVDACLFCDDHFGSGADISFCDTWHSPLKGRCEGLTSALCYSQEGREYILMQGTQAHSLTLDEDRFEEVLRVQGHMKPSGSVDYLLGKRLSGSRILHASSVAVSWRSILAAHSYRFVIGVMGTIPMRYYPIQVLALSRIFKKLLRF